MSAAKDVTVSDDLLHFLSDWLDWAGRCGEATEIFSPCEGLCGGLGCWVDRLFVESDWAKVDPKHGAMARELKLAFNVSGLHTLYPFGEENYENRISERSQHLDPARLAWVKEVIHNTMREGVK